MGKIRLEGEPFMIWQRVTRDKIFELIVAEHERRGTFAPPLREETALSKRTRKLVVQEEKQARVAKLKAVMKRSGRIAGKVALIKTAGRGKDPKDPIDISPTK